MIPKTLADLDRGMKGFSKDETHTVFHLKRAIERVLKIKIRVGFSSEEGSGLNVVVLPKEDEYWFHTFFAKDFNTLNQYLIGFFRGFETAKRKIIYEISTR